MLSEQIRSIGVLADAIFQAAIKAASLDGGDDPPPIGEVDLAAIAASALDDNGTQLLPCPHDAEAIQLSIRLAERMLATLFEADAARAAAAAQDEWSNSHWVDDTGPATEPRWRRSRFNRGRIWGTGTELCVLGEDRDVVRVRGVQFEGGAAFIGLMANASRAGHRPECYFGAAAAREVANALLEWAHALDPAVTPRTRRRRSRRIEARRAAASEAQDARTDAA